MYNLAGSKQGVGRTSRVDLGRDSNRGDQGTEISYRKHYWKG